jgi:catalase
MTSSPVHLIDASVYIFRAWFSMPDEFSNADGHPTGAVYAPNSYGGPAADTARFGEPAGWLAAGEMVRHAYTLRSEDDDWRQPGTMVREVLDDAARSRLVDNVSGHLANGVSAPVLERAVGYWRNVDKDLGDRIAARVNGG